MEIDYDLVKKIGATHYDTRETEFGFTLYKISGGDLFYNIDTNWCNSTIDNGSIVRFIKPIPPKPQVRFEYEEVKISAKEFFKSMTDGAVFYNHDGSGTYIFDGDTFLSTYNNLILMCKPKVVYRRVEKVVDWRDEVVKWLNIDTEFSEDILLKTHEDFRGRDIGFFSPEDFLEMCRIALRATGELK